MTKKEYMKPAMKVVRTQQQHIICASQNGMNTSLQGTEVTGGWSRRHGVWDWDDEEE